MSANPNPIPASTPAAPVATEPATGEAAPAKKRFSFGMSPEASRKLFERLHKRGTPDAALRVGVRGGGCSGFSYVLEFTDDAPRENRDLVFEYAVDAKEGDPEPVGPVRIICDKKSIIYLNEGMLDWEKTLMYQGFKFVNPHEKSSCGCRESFSV